MYGRAREASTAFEHLMKKIRGFLFGSALRQQEDL